MRRPCGLMDRASASGSCRRSRRAAARRDSSPPSLRRGGLRGASRRFTVRLRARSSLLDIMHFFFPFSGQGRGAGGRVLRRRDAAGQGCPLPAAFNFGRAHPSSRARGGGGGVENMKEPSKPNTKEPSELFVRQPGTGGVRFLTPI